MHLPEIQLAVLETASPTEARPVDQLAAELDEQPEAVAGAAFALEAEGLVAVETDTETEYVLTAEGDRYRESGLPETRLYRATKAAEEPVSIDTAAKQAGLGEAERSVALANFARKGFGTIENGTIYPAADAAVDDDPEADGLVAVAAGETPPAGTTDRLLERGLIDRQEQTTRRVRVTDDGVTALMEGVEVQDAVGAVTPELLTSGDWADVEFRSYNVAAAADEQPPGRPHVLRALAERVKEVLVGMGFHEMTGPHVDADFWINDCLYMPQDHPARTHWDRFAMAEPTAVDGLPADLVERVKTAHQEGVGPDGDGYNAPWEETFAEALALRGHTTSLTARYLAGEAVGEIDPPARYFSVEKAYRNDTLDATHLLEFFQIEGWVMADGLSVRDLMGTFEEFYARFGITDIEFKPHYNPYTEPSFELFGEHPETGELIEIGNSGIFRPEMLEPLGVESDVMAWGLALERLAMLLTGAEDIRDLHGTLVDLEFLRNAEVVY